MRLFHVTTYYVSYLKQFYNNQPGLEHQTYSKQHQYLINDCFGWSDFWSEALKPLGYEVLEVIANAESMQKMWADEQGVTYKQGNWLNEIVLNQVIQFKPEILFIDDHNIFLNNFVSHIRQSCSSIKLVIGWCGSPYKNKTVFQDYDIVLSNIPELVQEFRKQGHKSEYLKHAFDPKILDKINLSTEKNYNFSFFGSLIKGSSNHEQREKIIKVLIEKANLQVWSEVNLKHASKHKVILQQLIYDITKNVIKMPYAKVLLSRIPKVENYVNLSERPQYIEPLDKLIAKNARLPLYGLTMFQKIQDSKLIFNNHINLSYYSASNMRLFETTGVGSCLITDWKKNISELFEPEQEVVTYNSIEECVEKVKYLLNNPEKREAIARAGQQRTLKNHTFTQRAITLNNIILKKY